MDSLKVSTTLLVLLVLLTGPVWAGEPPSQAPLPPQSVLRPPQAPPTRDFPDKPDEAFVTYTYEEGSAKAKAEGKILLTWVEKGLKKLPGPPPPGYLLAVEDSLKGFPNRCLVVSKWVNGKHLGIVLDVSTYNNPEAIKAAADTLSKGLVSAAPPSSPVYGPPCYGPT